MEVIAGTVLDMNEYFIFFQPLQQENDYSCTTYSSRESDAASPGQSNDTWILCLSSISDNQVLGEGGDGGRY